LNQKVKQLLKVLIFGAIGITLLYFVFKGVDIAKMWVDIKKANFFWIALSLVFAFVGYLSRAMRWNCLLQPLGYKATLKNSFLAVVFGYFANLLIPRIGEVARCGVLSRQEKIPVDKLLGTVIVERVIDLLMLMLIGIITFFVKIDLFGTFILERIIFPIKEAFANTNLVVLALVLMVLFGGLIFIVKTRNRFPLAKKITSFISGILQGLKSVYTMKQRGKFIFHTLLIWICYWAMTYLVFFALPQTSHLDMADGLFILIVGGLGMSVPVQGGMGAFHYFVSHALVIFGLDQKTDGVLFATLSHESQTLFVIILGIISVIALARIKKKSNVRITENSK